MRNFDENFYNFSLFTKLWPNRFQKFSKIDFSIVFLAGFIGKVSIFIALETNTNCPQQHFRFRKISKFRVPLLHVVLASDKVLYLRENWATVGRNKVSPP